MRSYNCVSVHYRTSFPHLPMSYNHIIIPIIIPILNILSVIGMDVMHVFRNEERHVLP